MTKKFMTVLGEVSSDEMGITLPHEHFLWDVVRNYMNPLPKELSLRNLLKQKVNLENRGEVVYRCLDFEDNLYFDDVSVAIEEAIKFKESGGDTVFDLTLANIGRDPEALYKISIATGVNIVMGCGNYILSSFTEEDKKKTERQMAREIIDEFNNGVGKKRIKPGVIGEIGVSDINNPIEIKSLRASALAQKEIACAVNIHPGGSDNHKILDILANAGANLNRVVLSHCDPSEDLEDHDSLVKRGAYIEFDMFGHERMSVKKDVFLPCDGERIKAILAQIKKGNIEKILISTDICMKIFLTKWGGYGYSHIINHIIPRMLQAGITQEQIDIMTIENPRKLLCP